MKRISRKYGKKAVIAAGWILVWQLAAALVGNRILLVGPLETLQALKEQIVQGGFWLTVGTSLLRIGAGFTAGMTLGLLLAAVSSRFPLLEEVLAPVISLLKAIPVASFVVLFLIWWRSGVLATAVSFCIVLPNIYVNTLEGIRHVDRRLLEMANVLRIPAWNRFFYIYRPALKPYLDSAVRISVGMSWKSGVAAEVIGIPALSVGERLYLSKIYLDTAGVLAWTMVTILASAACERAVLALWRRFQRWEPRCRAAGAEALLPHRTAVGGRPVPSGSRDIAQTVLELSHVSKSYYDRIVLRDVTASYERGRIYYFRSPSGSGKTTLFRLIAGLEEPDCQKGGGAKSAGRGDRTAGTDNKKRADNGAERRRQADKTARGRRMAAHGMIERHGSRISMVFQEDRLCEEYSALVNVDMVTGDREKSRAHLCQLLEEEDLHKPCRELSGGMKRRVAIVRAMVAGGDVILLDEPFGGLDGESQRKAKRYIRLHGEGSALLVATHTGEGK